MLRNCISKFLIAALFAFLCESGVLAQQYISRGGSDVPQRGVYEVALESSRTPAEPYLGVQFDVTFTTPRGVNVTVEGFYNGDRVFKARAYAGELGLWRWRSRSNNPGLDGKEGTFRVVPSHLKGKLRIHPSDPRQFAYDNGAWFLHIGDTGYRYLVADEPKWQEYIDQAAESGITKIRTWFAQSRSTIEAVFNSEGNGLALPYWQEMERRITYALERHPDVILQLIPYAEDTAVINRYAAGDTWAQYVTRYSQARWSAFPNVQWTMTNDREIVRSGPLQGRAVAWNTIDQMGKDMRRREPWGTLITNHQMRFSGYDFADAEWSGIVSLEDLDQVAGARILEYRAKSKAPVVLDEDRYELYRNPANRRYFFRRLMWASLLSGGHATYGGMRTFERHNEAGATGVAGYFTANRAGLLYQGAHDFVHIHEFFRDAGITLVGMTPDDALVGGDSNRWKCIHDNRTFIIYLANSDGQEPANANPATAAPTVEIQLPQGQYAVRWCAPQPGRWRDVSNETGGLQTLTAPARPGQTTAGDWVLLLRRN